MAAWAAIVILLRGWQWLRMVEGKDGRDLELLSCSSREAPSTGDFNYLQLYGLPFHPTLTSFAGSQPRLHIVISYLCSLDPNPRDSD